MEIAPGIPRIPCVLGSTGSYRASAHRRYGLVERKLLEFAGQRPFTLRETIDTLGPTLGSWPGETNQDFSYGMLGNLDSLTRRGLLTTRRNNDQLVVWEEA